MAEFVTQGSKWSVEQWEKQNNRLGQMLFDQRISESPDWVSVRNIRKSYQAVNHLYPRLMEMKVSTEDRDKNENLNTKILTSLMSLQLEQLVNSANDLSQSTQFLTLERRNFVQQLIVALGISAVVIICINIYLIGKSVVRPLKGTLQRGRENRRR